MPSTARSRQCLPTKGFASDEAYVTELLHFVTSSTLLQTLVSSVHILDFFSSTSDLYEATIDPEWRQWFALHDLDNIVGFLLHEDVDILLQQKPSDPWRGRVCPPRTLLQYLSKIRRLSLCRDFKDPGLERQVTRQLSVGMRPKKIHEVDHFARYVQKLTTELMDSNDAHITHLVDFGAGQGYLGRFLASEPINSNVIAVESKASNVEVAKAMDVIVKLAPMAGVRRNKKEYRSERAAAKKAGRSVSPAYRATRVKRTMGGEPSNYCVDEKCVSLNSNACIDKFIEGKGSVQHVQHNLKDGDLQDIVNGLSTRPTIGSIARDDSSDSAKNGYSSKKGSSGNLKSRDHDPALLVISLHSCGNLSHHALRSLAVNPAVRAVAVIGCCYNLLTERLGPPSYKSESLRPQVDTLDAHSAVVGDAQGFPMSTKLAIHRSKLGTGISFNVTARMMAVQAPENWTKEEADLFFTRHFFRALLQRLLVDRGIADFPLVKHEDQEQPGFVPARSPAGGSGSSKQPIIIGSLSKSAFKDFTTYGQTAIDRVRKTDQLGKERSVKIDEVTSQELERYARKYASHRKDVGIVWTLMALSATLVETVIVVDRWLWLREQEEVERCWVEPAFDYKQSPRNLVVVGVKKASS